MQTHNTSIKMSFRQQLICRYCGRKDFLSRRGFEAHLSSSNTCSYQARGARNRLHALTLRQSSHELSEHQGDLGTGPLHDTDHSHNSDDSEDEDVEQPVIIIEDQDNDDWGVPFDVEQDLDPTDQSHLCLIHARNYVKTAVNNYVPFSADEERVIKLMLMLRKKGATLDTVDEVMKWHLQETGVLKEWMRPSDTPQFISRQVMFKKLKARHNFPPQLFMKTEVKLPSIKTKVKVIHFDAKYRVMQLLTDPRLSDDDYLHHNNDPFGPPPSGDLDVLSDINTGKSYIETHKAMVTNSNELLVPIILYQDGTVTGQFDKLPVEPVKMTLGIFNRKARDRPEAWKVLGYIPSKAHSEISTAEECFRDTDHVATDRMVDPTLSEDSDVSLEEDAGSAEEWEKSFEVSDHKTQDKHRILATILKSLKELCEEGMVWDYKHRGKLHKKVKLLFYIAFVKVDTDEADKLCGHYTTRHQHTKSICRYCLIPTDQLDSIKLPPNTKMKKPSVIEPLVVSALDGSDSAKAKLKEMSQHPIKNVFCDLPFGVHNEFGIHGASPMEPLHQIQLGTFPMVRSQFLGQVGDGSRTYYHINDIARVCGRFFARQSERDLPRTSFSKGIFAAKLTGKEMCGVLLLIATALQSTNGRALLRDKGGKKYFGEEWLLDDWHLLVELLLQWEAYLKSDEMKVRHVKRLKRKHAFLMGLIKKIANRSAGMGLKLVKFHAILHLSQDIIDFGVPGNVDTAPNEKHHHPTKLASKMTQKDALLFEEQTATREEEQCLLELANAEIKEQLVPWEYFLVDQVRGPNASQQQPVVTTTNITCGAQLRLYMGDDDEPGLEFVRNQAEWCRWHPALAEFLWKLLEEMKAFGLESLDTRTEHRRKGNIFRAHPNYRRRGPWHDWATIDWGFHGESPAEIACFVDLSRVPVDFGIAFAGCTVQRGCYAVVESAEYEVANDNSPLGRAEIFQPLRKEVVWLDDDVGGAWKPRYYLAPVESIVGTLCVVPDIGPHKTRHFRVLPRSEWAKLFEKWLEAPHNHDEEELQNWEEASEDE